MDAERKGRSKNCRQEVISSPCEVSLLASTYQANRPHKLPTPWPVSETRQIAGFRGNALTLTHPNLTLTIAL